MEIFKKNFHQISVSSFDWVKEIEKLFMKIHFFYSLKGTILKMDKQYWTEGAHNVHTFTCSFIVAG